MDNLKSIWQQLDHSVNQLGKIVHSGENNSIFEKLEKEAALRKKFNPVLITMIVLFTVFFIFIVQASGNDFNFSTVAGISLVVLASIIIATFSQVVKMPLQEFRHDKSSTKFLKIVKNKLDQSRKMLVIGILLQNILLTLGIYLLVFFNQPNQNDGMLLTFLGVMFGLGGLAVGSSIAFFNQHYKGTYTTIDLFLKE